MGWVLILVTLWRPAEMGCSVPFFYCSNNKSAESQGFLPFSERTMFGCVLKKINDLVDTRSI